MTIYGLTAIEIVILERWSRHHNLNVVPVEIDDMFADVREARRQWANAGGVLPVTEPQALFLKPGRAA